MYYATGWNMGGYSPDPDHIYIPDDWQSAIKYLTDAIDIWWDQDYDYVTDPEEKLAIDARYLDVHTELHNMPAEGEYHAVINDINGYAQHLWIVPTDEIPDGE